MFYIEETGEVYIKYIVKINEKELLSIRKEIIDNCSEIRHYKEKIDGDYEKDWNDTPAGKKAVIAGRQLLCTAYRRHCSVSWINHTKRNQRLYEKTAFLFYLSLSGRSDCRKYCNYGNTVRYNL